VGERTPRAARGSVEQRGLFMTKSRLVMLGIASLGLMLPAASGAVRPAGAVPTETTIYTVGGLTVLDTGLVLSAGASVSVTATGAVCVSGYSMCPGPNGNPAVDTTSTAYGGYPLPGAPAYGLIGRVGDGPWLQIGGGPTTVSGTGSLKFAVNDDYVRDNTGSFTVSVTRSLACFPGWGYGDGKHPHLGPPGILDSCYPGHGYGDAMHVHTGPPGQDTSTVDGASRNPGPPGDKPHGQGGPQVDSPGNSQSGGPGDSASHGKHGG
jgi:hypothetical protein